MVCFAEHLRKILHHGLVFFVCFCARSRNSLAHKLPAPLVLSSQSSCCPLWFFVSVFVSVCFCCLVLVLFLFCFGPDKTSDCVLVRTPLFDSPRRDMDNSFISTTMCDDLARATEAQDGKNDCPSLRRCLMPGGLHSTISGILTGGILGFGAAESIVFAGHLRKILLCGLVLFICFCARSRIHWRISCQPDWSCLCQCLFRWVVRVCFLLFLFVFVFLLCLCFLLFGPDMTSDCVMVHIPLLTPQGGT